MRSEKQLLLDDIEEKLDSNDSFIVTRYENFNSGLTSEFRGTINSIGGDFEIMKKRLLYKALTKRGLEISFDKFQGHIGVIFSGDDSIVTAKSVVTFNKNSAGTLEIVTGKFDNKFIDANQILALSKLPEKNELRAQFLGLLEAPMSQTLATMEALLTSVPHCLNNKSEEK